MRKVLSLILSILFVLCNTIITNANDDKIILTALSTVSIHNQVQKGFLSSPVDYYSYYGVGMKENSRPDAVVLSWISSLKGSFTVVLSESEDLSKPRIFTTTNKKISVYNLKIATKYFWKVSCGDFESEVSSFETEGYYPRNMYVDKVANVRDLGGFHTTDGSVLRQGVLYRGGRFNKVNAHEITISESGAKTLVNTLGVKTEIDLRVSSELGGWTESILNSFEGLDRKVNYYICPLDPSDKKPYYYLLRDNNLESTKQIFELLADKDNYPIYFHCSLGTDRAGELSDILHYLCSVSPEDVDYNYAFSNLAYIGGSRDYSKPSRTALKQLILNYGDKVDSKSTAACLKDKLGLSNETINNIIDILIDDSIVNSSKSEYQENCLQLTPQSDYESTFVFDSFKTDNISNCFLQMKISASKNIFVKNAIKIGDSQTENLSTDFYSDLSFSTEWQTVDINLSSLDESSKKYISLVVPTNNKDVDFYFDDIVILDKNKKAKEVINTYQHYVNQYDFVNGTDYFGNEFIGISKVVQQPESEEQIFEPKLDLKMLNGAQIRIGDKNGLRYITRVNTNQLDELVSRGYSVEFGTLITPADYLTNLNDLTFDLPALNYLVVPYTKELIDGNFKGSLVNIIESNSYNLVSGNLNRGFVGRGYAKISKDDFSSIVYAELDDNVRSVSEIAYKYKIDAFSDYYLLSDVLKGFIDKWANFYLNNETKTTW